MLTLTLLGGLVAGSVATYAATHFAHSTQTATAEPVLTVRINGRVRDVRAFPDRLRTLARHGKLKLYSVGTPAPMPVHTVDERKMRLPRRTPGASLVHNPAPQLALKIIDGQTVLELHKTKPSRSILITGLLRNVWWRRALFAVWERYMDLRVRSSEASISGPDELETWWKQGISTSASAPTWKERRAYTGTHHVVSVGAPTDHES